MPHSLHYSASLITLQCLIITLQCLTCQYDWCVLFRLGHAVVVRVLVPVVGALSEVLEVDPLEDGGAEAVGARGWGEKGHSKGGQHLGEAEWGQIVATGDIFVGN